MMRIEPGNRQSRRSTRGAGAASALGARLLSACLLSACLLSACAVGPSFTRPEPPAATRYTLGTLHSEQAPPDPATQHIALGKEITADWWTLFHSPAIDQVVSQAVEHNQTLAAAAATLAQAQEIAVAQGGTLYPQVALSAGVGRQQYGEEFLGGAFRLPPFTYFAVGPVVSYTLDYTGGLARGVEQQVALAQAKRHQLDAAYLAVTGQAVMQTLAIASSRAQIATVETLIAQDRETLRLVETALKEGSVARIDVLSAQSQIASDMALLPPLRQDLAKARHTLSVVLGRTTAEPLPPDIDFAQITLPLDVPASLPSELAHHRPDILAAEAQLHAATSAVGVAESNLYPKITLSGTVGQQSTAADALFDHANTAWSLISGLTMPLFDGGTLRAQERAAVDTMHASAANYRQKVLEAFAQVADMLEALDHDAEQLDAQSRAQQAAQSSLELARASYAEGNTGLIQVLDAQRLSQQARLGYVRAVAQRYIDTAQLFLALGGTPPQAATVASTSRGPG